MCASYCRFIFVFLNAKSQVFIYSQLFESLAVEKQFRADYHVFMTLVISMFG